MENKKVQVQVNVINQLKLLRQSTFKDPLCFLDEDIQNAQRAKATDVRIEIKEYDNQLVIENNGQVLSNSQSLFSIAESEWDEGVVKTENPFGMGFFSNSTVSNLINIHSGNKLITFDVEHMIKTGDTEIKVEEVEDYYEGFKLVLNNFDYDDICSWDIKERIETLAKYIHELDVYLDDELLEKKDLTEGDNSLFQTKIDDNNSFSGWIALSNNWGYSDNIGIFYKGRFVTKLEGVNFVHGDIHITDKALNLTSPDRKDIIRDEKLKEFKQQVKSNIELLAIETMLDGDPDDLGEYSSAISLYIDKKLVKNKIKFITFKSNNEDDLKYLKGIALTRNSKKPIKNFKDYEVYLKEDAVWQGESHFDEINIATEIQQKVPPAKGVIYHEGGSSYTSSSIEKPEIKENDTIEREGVEIIKGDQPVFYLSFDEVEKYEYKLNIARHYDIKIIISRNQLETSILKEMKESDNVLHISELNEKVEVNGSLTNTELNCKEKRALMLLDMISRIVGFSENVFAIGNLMVTKHIKVESLDIQNEIIEDSVLVLKDAKLNKVYIDRTIIVQNVLRDDLETNLDINDYKFILCNIQNIVSELSLLKDSKNKDEILDIILNTLGGKSNE